MGISCGALCRNRVLTGWDAKSVSGRRISHGNSGRQEGTGWLHLLELSVNICLFSARNYLPDLAHCSSSPVARNSCTRALSNAKLASIKVS
jgi:hypothetical protein